MSFNKSKFPVLTIYKVQVKCTHYDNSGNSFDTPITEDFFSNEKEAQEKLKEYQRLYMTTIFTEYKIQIFKINVK